MKKLKFLGMAAAAAGMVLLTSCMDGNNEETFTIWGVVAPSEKTYENVVYNNSIYSVLYIPEIAKDPALIGDQTCIQLNTTVSMDDAENANAATNGYYTGRNNGYGVVKKVDLYSNIDTANIQENELAFGDAQPLSYIKNYLFVAAFHPTILSKQENDFTLSWDYKQEPQVESDKRVYTMFLRATKTKDGEAPSGTNVPEVRASNISSFYNQVKAKEQAAGKDVIYFKINYVKEFNADTTAVKTWGSSLIVPLEIVKDK